MLTIMNSSLLSLIAGRLCRTSGLPLLNICREANKCADFLARMGAKDELVFINFPCKPSCISKLLEDDRRGFCLPRFANSS